MKRVLRFGFVALPLLGALELVLHFFFASRAPSFDAWSVLETTVREMKQQGDVVVVAPAWADPVARRALGDELMPMRDEARPDISRYAGAIEIAIFGKRAPELEGFHEEERRRVGDFEVRRLSNENAAHVVYDFTDHVKPPAVDVRTMGATPEVSCAWNPHAAVLGGGLGGHPTFPAERFECPQGSFFNVGVTIIADEAFKPRRCIWSHPVGKGELVTRFQGVPLGDVIRGHGGMYWIVERELRGAPIHLRVAVDGETIGSYNHVDGDGWKAFEMPLGAHARAPSATVEFAVSSDNNRDRHFCFEADTR